MPSFVARLHAAEVERTPDLERVLALPRRPVVEVGSVRAEALVELMTARLARPDPACVCRARGRAHCLDRLLFPQAWGLYEAGLAGGLLAPIGVGAGKTLLGILAPMVVKDCRVAVILVPPGLVGQLRAEHEVAGGHFTVPSLIMPDGTGTVYPGRPRLHVVPYSLLQQPRSSDLLRRLAPDLVIADEAHSLKSRSAARTLRVLRHFAASEGVRLACWSGTITSRSIDDFAHLSALALGEGSPLPIDPDEVIRWAAVVDPSDWAAPAGALKELGSPVREALGRRVLETRGVVSTSVSSLPGCAVVMREWDVGPMPEILADLIDQVHATMERPDGEELLTALQVAACVDQLICGFYYRWRFPGKPDPALVDEWFAARKAYGSEMRERLKRPSEHMDSKRLLTNAAERHEAGYRGDLPTWASDAWVRWRDVKDRVKHVTETMWVDDYLARAAAEWAATNRGVVWTAHTALGHEVAHISGLTWHGGGPGAAERIAAEDGKHSIVVSIDSHGTGRDCLQRVFDTQLVTSPPCDGQAWEQLLGRLHRIGQDADEVVTHVPRHVPEFAAAIDKAIHYAKYIQGITTNNQRLLAANVEWA